MILLEGVDPDQAGEVLEKARRDLQVRHLKVRENEESIGSVTVSIGAATMQGVEPEIAIKRADELLYRAKKRGRNRVMTDSHPFGV